jgi:hypothetical protein
LIVATPWLSGSIAFVGPARLRKKVSSASSRTSLFTTAVTVLVVWPGSKVRLPIADS